MATKFTEIYEKAIWKIRDFDSLLRTPEISDKMYFNFLLSAISDIEHYSPIPLAFSLYPNPNDDDQDTDDCGEDPCECTEDEEPEIEKEYVFDYELSHELKDLLSLGIAVKWMEPLFLNSDALKKGMYNKDYRDFGLDADRIAEIYHTLRRMFEGRARTMSFRHSNFERWSTTRRRPL